MITGDRCAAQGIDPQSSKGCQSRPRLKHSRAGYSGNPCGASLRGELASLEAGCPAYAPWIPVPQGHAEMTGWPTGWPRARATPSGYALPRTKLGAAGHGNEKCEVDQAKRIHFANASSPILRRYLESRLSKVFVKGKRDLDFAPLHQRKGDAISQRIAFIAMALKQSPALLKQRLVNMHQVDQSTGEEEPSDLHCFGMLAVSVEERHDLVQNIRSRNQGRMVKEKILPKCLGHFMMLVIEGFQRDQKTSVEKVRRHSFRYRYSSCPAEPSEIPVRTGFLPSSKTGSLTSAVGSTTITLRSFRISTCLTPRNMRFGISTPFSSTSAFIPNSFNEH